MAKKKVTPKSASRTRTTKKKSAKKKTTKKKATKKKATRKKTARKKTTRRSGPRSSGARPASPKKILTREKRVLLTLKEEQELEIAVLRLGQELECSLGLSHVLRSCIRIIRHAEKKVLAEARKRGPMLRPANDDIRGIEDFEVELSKMFLAAFKKSASFKRK